MGSVSDHVWAQLRKDIGDHCKRRGDFDTANRNFEASLQYDPEKLDSVYLLTNSLAKDGKLDNAMKFLRAHSESSKQNFQIETLTLDLSLAEAFKHHFYCNLQECDCNYEKNLFENNFLLLSDKTRQFRNALTEIPHTTQTMTDRQIENLKKGPKVSALQTRFETVSLVHSFLKF